MKRTKAEIETAELVARWAKAGAIHGDCGRMCNECAFKKDALGNTEPHNVGKALIALSSDSQFNCHINGDQDAGHPCAGFLYAQQYFLNRFKKPELEPIIGLS